MKTAEQELRAAIQTLRRSPLPLADLIPLLQKAADEIERLRAAMTRLRDERLLPEQVHSTASGALHGYRYSTPVDRNSAISEQVAPLAE